MLAPPVRSASSRSPDEPGPHSPHLVERGSLRTTSTSASPTVASMAVPHAPSVPTLPGERRCSSHPVHCRHPGVFAHCCPTRAFVRRALRIAISVELLSSQLGDGSAATPLLPVRHSFRQAAHSGNSAMSHRLPGLPKTLRTQWSSHLLTAIGGNHLQTVIELVHAQCRCNDSTGIHGTNPTPAPVVTNMLPRPRDH